MYKIIIYLSSVVLEAIILLKHSQIISWNQRILRNECKVSCSRSKKRLAPTGVLTNAARSSKVTISTSLANKMIKNKQQKVI
jgi:hypothetical protein